MLIVVMTGLEERRMVATVVSPELGWPAMVVAVLRWFAAHVGENGGGARRLRAREVELGATPA
jgi:hypothetical protein